MLKKLSIQARLTLLSVFLLAVCCLGLTAVLNLSASRMANAIEATVVTPAMPINPTTALTENQSLIAMQTLQPAESTQIAKTNFYNQSIFYMLLIVSLGGGVTYYMVGLALKPLKELNLQMKNCTVHNLSETLAVPNSHDEIAQLSVSFNQMIEKLDNAFAMQQRFSQSAAHELRTPLAILKTKIHVFNKKPHPTVAQYQNLVDTFSSQTERLSCLVTDLLDLTNMDCENNKEIISIKGLIEEVVQDATLLAKQQHITIQLQGVDKEILGNYNLLHRAFYNLIENAIKYNVPSGEVLISLTAQQSQFAVSIQDSGIGIAPAHLPFIFEPFYRIDQSRSRQWGGAGLGLATVKSIIEMHHGTIQVKSSENQSGTCFTVFL